MTHTLVEIYKAILAGAEYERLDTLHTLSIEQARLLGKETAFRTRDIIIKYEVARAENTKLIKQNATLVDVLKKIINYRDRVGPIHFQLEKMDDFLHQGRKAIAQVEKGV